MPIEFNCQNCGRLMRTPDAAAGKKGKCPSCGATMDIPSASAQQANTPAAPTSGSSSSKQVKGTKSQGTSDRIEFPCPKCSQPVRTPVSAAGKKGKCPSCGEVVQIPHESPSGPQAEVKPSAKIQFRCPGCQKLLRMPANVAGKKVKCPACSAVLSIPSSTKKKSPPEAQSGLAPLPDAAPGLVPLDDAPGLAPFEDAPALTPLDDAPGLTPIDEMPTLMPLDDAPGLTPLEEAPGLQPLDNSAGLVPFEGDPLASAASFEGSAAATSPLPAGAGTSPFGGNFGSPATPPGAMAANPYQSPALAPPGYAVGQSRPFNQTIVVAPAVAMMVVVGINCVVMIPYLIVYAIGAIGLAKAEQAGDEAAFIGFVVGSIIVVLIFVVVYVFMLFGAWKMMKLESYWMALTTAILMLFPCTFCWIGLPFGIWALIVLCFQDVRQAFT